MKALVEAVLVCVQQGLAALREHNDATGDFSKDPGNFRVLVKLLSKHDES